jgi:hypothetical protein
VLRRTHQDQFCCTAIDLEEAFVLERRRDYIGASYAYLQALKAAEQISADELSARAVLGQLRCQIAGSWKDPDDDGGAAGKLLRLRAQAMIQVQAARSPEIFGASPDSVPRIFVSYRSNTRPLSNSIARSLCKTKFTAWTDQRIKDCEDFSPAIHRELLCCSAMLLILGPEFFDSPWCLHELHFALGQNDQRGMPLFWVWCDQKGSKTVDGEYVSEISSTEKCSNAISNWKEEWLKSQAYPDYHRFHIEDRIQRVIHSGICLSQKVIRFKPTAAGMDAGKLDALDKLLDPLQELLKDKKEQPEKPRPPRAPAKIRVQVAA